MQRDRGFPEPWLIICRALISVPVLLVAWATYPSTVTAWARTGHRVVAIIAESRLTPAALAAVRSLLECIIRTKSATHSGGESATHSDVIPATYSDRQSATYSGT